VVLARSLQVIRAALNVFLLGLSDEIFSFLKAAYFQPHAVFILNCVCCEPQLLFK